MIGTVRTIWLAFWALAFATPALAQNCNDILRSGAFDETVSQSSYESRDRVMRFACNSLNTANGGGLGAVIYGVPMSANTYSTRIKQSCDQYQRTRDVSEQNFLFIREASVTIAQAWTKCMESKGVSLSVQQTPDLKTFLVTARYQNAGPGSALRANATLNLAGGKASCTCLSAASGDCSGKDGEFRLVIAAPVSRSLKCERQNAKGILFALDSDQADQKLASLPPIALLPAATVNPAKPMNSDGMCDYTTLPIASLPVQVRLHDFEMAPAMSLTYRGRGSNLGMVKIDPAVPFATTNVKMEADHNKTSGLFLTVDKQTFRVLAQYGNYGCDYDRGKRMIRNLTVETTTVGLFD